MMQRAQRRYTPKRSKRAAADADVARLARIARQVTNKLRACGLGLDAGGSVHLAPRVEVALKQAEQITDPGARLDFLLAFADELAPSMSAEARRWALPDTAFWREALGRPGA